MTQASPFVIEIHAPPTPEEAARCLAHLPHLLLLESSMRQTRLGRYSFLSADPAEWFQPGPDGESETFDWLNQRLAFRLDPVPGLPPFQGGVAGLFGYEFNASIECIAAAAPTKDPAVSLGLYDAVIAWDHELDKCWIISTGAPEQEPTGQQSRAAERARFFKALLESPSRSVFQVLDSQSFRDRTPSGKWFPCPAESNLTSNFDREGYLKTIQQALDYIHAGDIFQVNIAQQLCHPATTHSLELYQNLREYNPATFAAYFDTGHSQVISASPERLVSVQDRIVETRPIKGTRRRTKHPEVDINVGQQLLTSEKDRAENVMIVDLMRNDLSRICSDDSVEVTQYVQLESYASVLHL
ncbi:MAG: chorismate-binding protein, partial [Pirellulaceae bacterium]|nr:chorismate-binding protein [Pirellulaceae bacterium]